MANETFCRPDSMEGCVTRHYTKLLLASKGGGIPSGGLEETPKSERVEAQNGVTDGRGEGSDASANIGVWCGMTLLCRCGVVVRWLLF